MRFKDLVTRLTRRTGGHLTGTHHDRLRIKGAAPACFFILCDARLPRRSPLSTGTGVTLISPTKKMTNPYMKLYLETEKQNDEDLRRLATMGAKLPKKRVAMKEGGPVRRSRRIQERRQQLQFITPSPLRTSTRSLPAEAPSAISAGSSSARPQLEDSTTR